MADNFEFTGVTMIGLLQDLELYKPRRLPEEIIDAFSPHIIDTKRLSESKSIDEATEVATRIGDCLTELYAALMYKVSGNLAPFEDAAAIYIRQLCQKSWDVLIEKSKEYAVGDRFYNFEEAAKILDCAREDALRAFAVKHWVSINTIVKGDIVADADMITEKCGDALNYLVLCYASVVEGLTDAG